MKTNRCVKTFDHTVICSSNKCMEIPHSLTAWTYVREETSDFCLWKARTTSINMHVNESTQYNDVTHWAAAVNHKRRHLNDILAALMVSWRPTSVPASGWCSERCYRSCCGPPDAVTQGDNSSWLSDTGGGWGADGRSMRLLLEPRKARRFISKGLQWYN